MAKWHAGWHRRERLSSEGAGSTEVHVKPRCALNDLEKGMLGKFRWKDHEGRMYQGTTYAVEPDGQCENGRHCRHDARS